MIDAKALRKENILKMNDDTVIVKGLPADGFIQFALFSRPSIIFGEPIDEFEPIPLTEEWLIKFNLIKRKKIDWESEYYEYSIRNEFEIYCHMDQSGNCLFWGEKLVHDFFIIKCDDVHTFQNIYAVLNPHEKLKDNV